MNRLNAPSRSMTIAAVLVFSIAIPCSSQGIEQALDEPFSIVVENRFLDSVLNEIISDYDVNCIVDNRVVRPSEPDRVDDQAEYVTNGQIEHFEVTGVSLREGLALLLEPLGLRYSVQPSFIWISAPELMLRETFEDLETRYYVLNSRHVADVNAELRATQAAPIDFVELVDQTVPSILEPVTGKTLSFVHYDDTKKHLIAHTTPSRHKKIELLLAATGQNAERSSSVE